VYFQRPNGKRVRVRAYELDRVSDVAPAVFTLRYSTLHRSPDVRRFPLSRDHSSLQQTRARPLHKTVHLHL
jgi:hypothetical protein